MKKYVNGELVEMAAKEIAKFKDDQLDEQAAIVNTETLNEISYIGTSATLKKKKWEIVMTDTGQGFREKV